MQKKLNKNRRLNNQEGSSWLADYAKKNLLKTASAACTTYGLIIIFTYHLQIEYYPPFNLSSAGGTILSAAYVGFLIALVLSLLLFIPNYFIWSYCSALSEKERTPRALELVAVTLILFWSSTGFLLFAFEYKIEMNWLFALFAVTFPLAWIYKGWSPLKPGELVLMPSQAMPWRSNPGDNGFGSRIRRIFREKRDRIGFSSCVVVVGLTQVFSILVFMLFISGSPIADKESVDWWMLSQNIFLTSLIMQVVSGFLLVTFLNKRFRAWRFAAIGIALLYPFLFGLALGSPSFLFSTVAYQTKIGNFLASDIALSAQVCDALAKKNGTSCQTLDNGSHHLCNAVVMSRAGSEHYVQISLPIQSDKKVVGNRIVDVYIPEREILKTEVDPKKRFHSKEQIQKYLLAHPSICPA